VEAGDRADRQIGPLSTRVFTVFTMPPTTPKPSVHHGCRSSIGAEPE
jgi:hypothetical protein